jgi:nitrogen fixation NifU-like protein
MSDLRDLYQEVLLDHNRRPRNFQKLEGANRTAEGYNPLCGDQITVYLKLEDDVIRDISFQGSGCAISKSAASMMTAALKGKTRGEAEALFQHFHTMLTGKPGAEGGTEALGKLAVFAGVCEFPIRVKCATLPWHTLHAALEGKGEPVSTE